MTNDINDDGWGTRTIVRAFTPAANTYHRTFQPHGLAHQGTWVWACVVAEDGQQYAITREFKAEATTLAVVSRLEPGNTQGSPRMYDNLYLGIVQHDIDSTDGRVRVASYPAKGALPFSVEIEPQRYHHVEAGGAIDLRFTAMGPAMQYLSPGEREDALYASEFCEVAGTVQGRPARGFGGMDLAWGPVGVAWTQGKIYTQLEEYWVVFVNEFTDGSREYGVAVTGVADFSVGFLVRNGVPLHLGDASIQMRRGEDGFPATASIRLGSESYHFATNAKVAQIKGLMQWASGEMIQDGAPPVGRRFAWLEYFAKTRRPKD